MSRSELCNNNNNNNRIKYVNIDKYFDLVVVLPSERIGAWKLQKRVIADYRTVRLLGLIHLLLRVVLFRVVCASSSSSSSSRLLLLEVIEHLLTVLVTRVCSANVLIAAQRFLP